MKIEELTWGQFKQKIEKHIRDNLETKSGARMCRGQSNSEWKLKTSFHRNPQGLQVTNYFQLLPILADWMGTITDKHISTATPEEMAAFIARVQHHGYPTPLLDWTLSPYIAAYFAFAEIREDHPESDHCAVYILDYFKWQKLKQSYDFDDPTPHVSILAPKSFGNKRQLQQQGLMYTFTNVEDVEAHIQVNETRTGEVLEKYLFSVKERPIAMRELEVMGIHAFSLFGGPDGLCRYFRESIFMASKIGKTPAERIPEMLKQNPLVDSSTEQESLAAKRDGSV